MTLTTLTTLIARFTHRLHDHDARPEMLHPSQRLPVRVVLTRHEDDDLARAA